MSADNRMSESTKPLTDILSAQSPTAEDVNGSHVYANNPHAINAAETLNGELDFGEPVPEHLALEMANFNKGGSIEPDVSSPKPETAFSKSVREDDESTVDQWIAHLAVLEKKRQAKPKYRTDDPRFDPTDLVPVIDRVDNYDKHYNAVHNAVITNNVRLLYKLRDAGADLNCRTSDQAENPPLVLAVFRFSDDVTEESRRLTDRFSFTSVPLQKQVASTTFHALLQCQSVREKVNASNRAGITALHAACRRGNTAMVDTLLKVEGIEIDKQDKHGNTPLHAACANGNLTTVATLIKYGANYQLTNKLEMHPFHVAVTVGKLDVVAMIRNDSSVSNFKEDLLHSTEEDGNTMFLLAVRGGHDRVVEFLLQNGAQLSDQNTNKSNAFHLAAAVNSCSIMEKLYAHDPGMSLDLIEAKDTFLLTPLHYAAKRNQKDVVSFLIEKSNKLEVEDAELNTPLLMAAAEGSSEVMSVLIKEGAQLTRTDGKGNNIVHLMVSTDNADVMKKVLDSHDFAQNTLIDDGNWAGQSALHKACRSGYAENCIELLKRGANPNLKDSNGCVPLHYAAESGNLEIVKLLADHHANIDAIDDQFGQTPLCVAAYHGNETMVEFLMQSGADIDGKFSDANNYEMNWKTSPLFVSCINGHVRIVKCLLEAGADVRIDKLYEDDEGKWSIKGNCLVLSTLLGQEDVCMCIINSAKWKSALRWRASNDEFGERTPLKLLISQMPAVAEAVLNRCIITTKKHNGTYVKKYYYEFLDDWHSKSRKRPDPDSNLSQKGHLNWRPHTFNKDAHTFQVMIDNKRIELLNHPLSANLLTYKWRSYGIIIYYINLFSYLVFLGFYTGFALGLQNPKIRNCRAPNNGTEERPCGGNGNQGFLIGAAIIIIAFSLIRILVELSQVYYKHFRYFLEFENWMELYLYSSSIAFVIFGLAADCQCTEFWQWEFGAVTLLIAWLNLVLFLKKFPLTGVYVLMFIHILTTILKILLLPVLFVVSFGLTFYMLFFRPDADTAFSTPANSIMRTMMFTMGEFDFDDYFYNGADDEGNSTDPAYLPPELLYPGATYVLWIVFIVVMPIVLINLLIGLAVDDIKGIQDESHLKRLALEVDFTMHLEDIAFIRNLFIKRMAKEYYTPDTQKFADSKVDDYPEQLYNWFQKLKLYYFGRSKAHQDDIKVTDEKTATERIEEEISDISVMVAEVRKRVKQRSTVVGGGKDVVDGPPDSTNQAKEIAEVKSMLTEHNSMLTEHKKKQDRILMLLEQVCSRHPDTFAVASSSGVLDSDDETTKRGGYTLDSGKSKGYSKRSSDE